MYIFYVTVKNGGKNKHFLIDHVKSLSLSLLVNYSDKEKCDKENRQRSILYLKALEDSALSLDRKKNIVHIN